MPSLNSRTVTLTLVVGHIAGMIDLSTLPVWINTLIDGYGYRPAVAGALPTVFLMAVVFASVVLVPRLRGVSGRTLAPVGYALAAASMLLVPHLPHLGARFALHAFAGLCIGTSLSIIHATIGKVVNPHRTFAWAYGGFAVFSTAFFAAVPPLLPAFGPNFYFYVIAGTFGFAALMTVAFLPIEAAGTGEAPIPRTPLSPAIKCAIVGISIVALIQAMVYSFVVQVGNYRGFPAEMIQAALIVVGFVNMLAPVLAAVLQKRLRALTVGQIAPLLQTAFAVLIMTTLSFPVYALPMVLCPAILLFTHTFIFGFLAEQDPTGRATSLTPAMVMTGSAVAPFIGGALLELAGYEAIAVAACLFGAISFVAFLMAGRFSRGALSPVA